MYKLWILLFLALSLGLGFCTLDGDSAQELDDTNDASLELRVKATFGGQPAVMFDEYALDDSIDLFFTRYSFYMDDLRVVDANGLEQLISDIAEVDLSQSHETVQGAQDGLVITFNNLAPGTYDRLQFAMGVPADENAQVPTDFPLGSPLSDAGEYWQGWKSYVFMKVEGNIDLDANPDDFERPMSLHCGGDEVYLPLSFDQPIVLTNGETTAVTLTIDLKEILAPTGGDAFDLISRSQLHSLDHKPLMQEIMDNVPAACSLQ